MDEKFDTGDIIDVRYFPIDHNSMTAFDVEFQTRGVLLGLFYDIMEMIADRRTLPRLKQKNGIVYHSRADLEKQKVIRLENILDIDLDRYARAFWFPPYDGACLEINGQRHTVVPQSILRKM